MTFLYDKSFEVDNGIVLDERNGVGIYSGVGSPVGTPAPQSSYYFNKTDGFMWNKYGALDSEWREVRPEFFQDHSVLFTSFKTGSSFNKNIWEKLCLGHLEGSGAEPPASTYTLTIIAENASGNSSVDIRLIRVDTGVQLGTTLNFTETVPTFKSVTFTPPVGDIVVELQGMKNGNSVGELSWCAIETRREDL